MGKTKTMCCKSRYVICYLQFRIEKSQTQVARVVSMNWETLECRNEKHVFKSVNRYLKNLVPGFLQIYNKYIF